MIIYKYSLLNHNSCKLNGISFALQV